MLAVVGSLFAITDGAEAQSTVGSCHMQAEGGSLFRSRVMDIKMNISGDASGRQNDCTLDLKTISWAGASVQGRGSVPIQVFKADLKTPPKHGTVDREDILINYRGRRGYRGVDSFTVVVSGRHADQAGSTAIRFTVAVR
jgi:hypothetical protein